MRARLAPILGEAAFLMARLVVSFVLAVVSFAIVAWFFG